MAPARGVTVIAARRAGAGASVAVAAARVLVVGVAEAAVDSSVIVSIL